ncbi:MAG: response regulator [Gemmataceae bacterium]
MGRSVLIADGFADAADSLAELLRLFGHLPYVARSGPEAVELAAAHRPDAAFVSLQLAGLDGYAVARALAAAGCRPRLLVALTGRGAEEDRAAAAAAGFDRHVLKPAEPMELVRLLDGLA